MKKILILGIIIISIVCSLSEAKQLENNQTKKAIRKDKLLDNTDFLILGKIDPDSAYIYKKFGKPDSVSPTFNIGDMGNYHYWIYKDFSVLLNEEQTVFSVTLKTSQYSTYREIKVGDPISKVKKMYDKFNSKIENYYDDSHEIYYCMKDDYMHVIRFMKDKNGKVASIYIGYIID